MAVASTRTLLPLDRFAQLAGIHPLHFNQIALPDSEERDEASCTQILMQHSWQADDALSREEIARAIRAAEDNMASVLGFDVAPRWNNLEIVTNAGQRARWMTRVNNLVFTPKGYVLAGGLEGKSPISLAASVAYSDGDGDGYKETATITVSTSVIDPQEIALYYPGMAGDDAWEIRPIHAVIDSGTATIVCRREQLVIPDILSAVLGAGVAQAQDDGDFLTTVDVYRHYNDPATQARCVWEPRGGLCECPNEGGCALCSYTLQDACITVHNGRLGQLLLVPGEWDGDINGYRSKSLKVYRSPEKAALWYRAGYVDRNKARPYLQMADIFERAVTNYALSMLDRVPCTVGTSRYEEARLDLALQQGGSVESTAYGGERVWEQSRFGTRKGAVDAWLLCEQLAIGQTQFG